ncbi:GNAT family N-acetyltransferase [Spirochaeta cellobiosiphila]|uniref:GNAT family N-acetyltransferase n=1 Tax=Spirochaeta cellobiosiphila TaxID=504483 RepID=UPI000410FBFC|nr:GNAT family N-acetyltransferase [Spirochaeta cellobiosiphila]
MIKYRKATPADASLLTAIQIEAFAFDEQMVGAGPPGYDSDDSQLLAISQYHYYVIEWEDIPIGGFIYSIIDRVCELKRVFILPEYQNQGIGSQVLSSIESMADIQSVQLEASYFHSINQSYYENRGYISIGRQYYTEEAYSIVYKKVLK